MKRIILSLSILVGVVASEPSFAVTRGEKGEVELTGEMSALIVSERFQTELNARVSKLKADGKNVQLGHISFRRYDSEGQESKIFVSVDIYWTEGKTYHAAGDITAALIKNQLGQLEVETVWFSPPVGLPGGASVGNN